MPAPDFATLYDIETAAESAWKTVLTPGVAACFTQRDTDDLPAVRVDAQCVLGQESTTRGLDKLGRPMAKAWDFSIGLLITTPRFTTDEAGAAIAVDKAVHARIRGMIRYLVQPILNTFDASVLPYHVFSLIQHASTSPTVNVSEDQDLTEMQYRGMVSVRDGAWPDVT